MIAASRIQRNDVVDVPPVQAVVAPVHAIKKKRFDVLLELSDGASKKFNGLPVALPLQYSPSSCPVRIMESIPKRLLFIESRPESSHVNVCSLGVSRLPKHFEFSNPIRITCPPFGVVLPLFQESRLPVFFPVGFSVSPTRFQLFLITFRHEEKLPESQTKARIRKSDNPKKVMEIPWFFESNPV